MFQLLYHTQLSLSVDFCLCTWIILFCIVLPITSLSMDEWKTEKYSINLFVCIEIWDSFGYLAFLLSHFETFKEFYALFSTQFVLIKWPHFHFIIFFPFVWTTKFRYRWLWTVHENFGGARKYWRWLRSAWHHLCQNKRFLRCRTVWCAWFPRTCLFRKQYSKCVWRLAKIRFDNIHSANNSILENSSIGTLNEEEEVLQWLITQKTEDRIELITRQMLETMVQDTQYLAVYFCKSNPKKSW